MSDTIYKHLINHDKYTHAVLVQEGKSITFGLPLYQVQLRDEMGNKNVYAKTSNLDLAKNHYLVYVYPLLK
jgi:hypothetical protein